MLIVIGGVLTAGEAAELGAKLAGVRFEDGRATAGAAAARVKDNAQARDGATVRLLREELAAKLLAHPVFAAAVRPKALTPLLFSAYHPGQAYGSHVDEPIMGGLRTDVSFTLFLSEPDAYEGGELVIEGTGGEQALRPGAGDLVAYPSTSLHRVEPVTRGTRLAVVGWAQSLIRDPARRELLFDLDTARHHVAQGEDERAARLLAKTAANLMRFWGEP